MSEIAHLQRSCGKLSKTRLRHYRRFAVDLSPLYEFLFKKSIAKIVLIVSYFSQHQLFACKSF